MAPAGIACSPIRNRGFQWNSEFSRTAFARTPRAAQTYDEDLYEIVLADQLGFRDAYISEHHGEPVYIDRVDTLPVPELLMCKAAALTKRIRMGAAVKLDPSRAPGRHRDPGRHHRSCHRRRSLHLRLRLGISQSAVRRRRGLSARGPASAPARVARPHPEVLDRERAVRLGRQVLARQDIVATPRPLHQPHMPMATATDTAT